MNMEIEQTVSLSPSSRLLLRVLKELKVADLRTLERETGLARRTLMYSVRQLRDAGLVEVQICLNDSRRRFYCLKPTI